MLFFHPSDDLTFFNYAIPGAGWAAGLGASLARMRAECAARARHARFEFIDEYAPGLDTALRGAGFVEEARQQLMVCTRETYSAAPHVPGLRVSELDHTAPLDGMSTFLTVQQRGFDPRSTGAASMDEARHFVQTLGRGRAFVARLREEAVAAGMYTTPLKVGTEQTRIAEIAGLATLAPYRRRGIATALAACAAKTAFDQGVKVAFLVAADARAGRVYERGGSVRERQCWRAWMTGKPGFCLENPVSWKEEEQWQTTQVLATASSRP